MKKRMLALLISIAMTSSALGAEDVTQTMFYVKVPLGGTSASERATSVGFMLKPAARPAVDFSFTPRTAYRRNATEAQDPFEAADFNWWLIGGLTAAALLLIATSRKSKQDEPLACQVSGNNPCPP
jgi:hypothetical protein